MRIILRFFGFLFSIGAMLFVVLAAAGAFFYWKYSQDLPDHAALANYEPPVMSRVHAADGSLLAEYASERRLYLPIQAMPKIVVAAFLSAEDKNFYKHGGIDPEGVVRAVLTNAKSGKKQGASTITQQVAKNFLLTNEQTFDRKIKEALIALRIESAYSKDKILELYLNEIFLGTIVPGRNLHGVAAAALDYFGKSVHELTINEAAYLAALPKGPNNYHPYRQTQKALDRRNEIIGLMAQNGYITKEEGEAARKMPLGVNPRVAFANAANANYFTEEVRREIAERYGEKKLYEGGLSVRATLDPKMQAWARKALVDGLIRYDQSHGWRGAQAKVDLVGRDWGLAVAEVPALGDVAPWRLAVVLSTAGGSAQIGLQPRREASNQISKDRETGTIGSEGTRWTGRSPAAALNSGDVIYVEAMDGGRGQYRLRQRPEVSGAIVAMDPYTGRVHAMVGGFSYDESQFNRATQAQRQPGSSFKPIVYSAALDNGYTPSSIVQDSPITIEAGPGQEAWSPSNYDGKSGGPHTLRYGIEHSKNLMTVRLAKDVGMPLIAEYARRFGVYDDMLPVLPMSLGAGETTVMRMVTAYSMLANGGRRIRPTLIDRIQDRVGETIYKHDARKCIGCDAEKWSGQDEPKLVDDSEQVLDPLTAYQMVSIMEGVVQRGTATLLKQIGKPLAGKTGTTNDAKDAWFVGFSPDLAGGRLSRLRQAALARRPRHRRRPLGPHCPRLPEAGAQGQAADPVPRAPRHQADPRERGLGYARRLGEGAGTILEAFKPGTAPPDAYVASPSSGGGGDRPRPPSRWMPTAPLRPVACTDDLGRAFPARPLNSPCGRAPGRRAFRY